MLATAAPPTRVSVLVPAYNEAAGIRQAVREITEALEQLRWDFELVIVDDGSSDGTRSVAAGLVQRHPRLRIAGLPRNLGKGAALRHGFSAATGDYIAFLDCDLELNPRQLHTLFERLQREQADLVIGSKRHPESRVEYPWHRRLVSTVYFWLVKWLFGLPIQDTQTGLKLFRREVLAAVLPRMLVKRYAFDLELLAIAHRLGYRIAQAPVVLETKRFHRRIRWLDLLHTGWDTLAVWYRMRLRHWYDRPGDPRR